MMEAQIVEGATGDRRDAVRSVIRCWPEWAVLFIYSALIAFMIPNHEPWADEAQGWVLARSVSLWQLFHTWLHYEGQPGLWHLTLWLLARLGVSYTGMHWVTGAVAVCSVALLVFCSPFPRWLKLTAPFTAFLLYQYPIVARTYVLVTLLIFVLALVWRRGSVPVAITLGLLANAEAHAFAISFGFACAYYLEHRKQTGKTDSAGSDKYWLAIAVLALLYLAAILTAFPARDVYIASYHPPGRPVHHSVLTFLVTSALSVFLGLWRSALVSLLGWFFVVVGLRARSAMRFLIPIAMFATLSGAVYIAVWHAGLLVPTLVAILWITWPQRSAILVPGEIVMRWAIAVLVILQIGWAAQAYLHDLFHDVSPDLRAANYLRSYVSAGDQIAVSYVRDTGTQAFHSVGIAPYFPGKLFMNQPFPFWWWSKRDTTEKNFLPALSKHPEVVVMEDYGLQPKDLAIEMNAPKIRLVESRGYHLARAFFADVPVVGPARMGLCHMVFLSNKAK